MASAAAILVRPELLHGTLTRFGQGPVQLLIQRQTRRFDVDFGLRILAGNEDVALEANRPIAGGAVQIELEERAHVVVGLGEADPRLV